MAQESAGLRIVADVGGTFTDIALETGDGSFVSMKVLTTHGGPKIGILAGIESLVYEHAVDLAQVEQIIPGTTLATTALIERRGARTALVTTKRFRDVIGWRWFRTPGRTTLSGRERPEAGLHLIGTIAVGHVARMSSREPLRSWHFIGSV